MPKTTHLDRPGFLYCTKHSEYHPEAEFNKNDRVSTGYDSWCKQARKEYQTKYREKLGTDYSKYRTAQERAYVIWKYGGKCAKCGNDDPVVLCLDHVNGDGDERGRGNKSVKDAIDNNYPDYLQLLCYNCNARKEKERTGNAATFEKWYAKWVERFEAGDIEYSKYEGKHERYSTHRKLTFDVP